MFRILFCLPLLVGALAAQQPEILPDPASDKGWARVAAKADILALPVETRHIHASRLTDVDLEALKRFKGLVSLTLQGEYTDAGVKHLAEFKGLRDLQIDCDALTDAALVHIGKLSALEWLGLERCHRITDKGLRELAGLKNVTWLILRGSGDSEYGLGSNAGITDVGLKHLASMTAMMRLDLSYLASAGDALADLGPRMKDLETLSLAYCDKAGEAAYKGLARCNALSRIDLVGQKKLGEGSLKALAGLKGLETLNLTICEGLDDTAIGALGKSKSLQELSVQGELAFGDAGLAELAKCKTLRRLELGVTPAGMEGGSGLGEEDPEAPTPPKPRPAPKAKFTDAALKSLGKAEGLRELRFHGLATITDAALLGLLDAPLEELALTACPGVTDKGLQVVGRMKSLRRLGLSALSEAAPLPGQEAAKKMRITNEGLRHLAGLVKLTELDLSGQAITDTGLEHLKGLSTLRKLVLQEVPGVTEAGTAGLQEAIEELDIEHDPGDGAMPPG